MLDTNNLATELPGFTELPIDDQLRLQAILTSQRAAREVSMMTPNSTTAGFTTPQAILPKFSVELPQRTAQELKARKRIVEQYGEISDSDVAVILDAESKAAKCDGCNGDCRQKNFRHCKPTVIVHDGHVYPAVERCRYGRQLDIERDFKSARIPARYIGKTFADYTVDANNEIAVEFAKDVLKTGQGAYFYGDCGAGKTFLASIIAQEFSRAGKTVLFEKVPDLLREIRETYDGNGDESDKLERIQAADVVILDDFGMEKSTQWAGATLCKVIDLRYDRRGGVTIITSNLSPKQLAEHLNGAKDGQNLNGSRVADRCREICKPILLKGTSRRN